MLSGVLPNRIFAGAMLRKRLVGSARRSHHQVVRAALIGGRGGFHGGAQKSRGGLMMPVRNLSSSNAESKGKRNSDGSSSVFHSDAGDIGAGSSTIRTQLLLNDHLTQFGREHDWRGLIQFARENFSAFDAVNWTTTFVKLGTIPKPRNFIAKDDGFRELMAAFDRRVEKEGVRWLKARGLSNIMYGMGALKVASSKLLSRLNESCCEAIVQEGSCQDIVILAYTLAKLDTSHETARRYLSTFEKVGGVERLLEEGNSQDFAHMSWATATTRHDRPGALARAIDTEEVARMIAWEGSPQSISNTIWGMAKLRQQVPTLAAEIEQEKVANKLVTTGRPQAISNTFWAMAMLGHKAPVLASKIETEGGAQKLVREGNSLNILRTLWAMAKLGHSCPVLIEEIENGGGARRIVEEGFPQHISRALWAVNTLGFEAPMLREAISKRRGQKVRGLARDNKR